MRKDFFSDTGGFDESFNQWGGEDNELGFRLVQNGALCIPERHAVCWHQGEGHEPSEAEKQSLRQQRAKMRHLIADPTFRRARPGQSFTVPEVLVEVDVGMHHGGTDAMRTVEGLLAGRIHDLVVHVRVPDGHPDHVWLTHSLEGEPRALVNPDQNEIEPTRFAPIRIAATPDALFARKTVAAIRKALAEWEVGVLHLLFPGVDTEAPVEVVLTRALTRARRIAPNDPLSVAGELFGERWESGLSVGMQSDVPATAWPSRRQPAALLEGGKVTAVAELLHDAEEQVARLRSRRIVQFMDAIGSVRQVRGPIGFGRWIKRMVIALFRPEQPAVPKLKTTRKKVRRALRSQ
jgi:hypothetical protein